MNKPTTILHGGSDWSWDELIDAINCYCNDGKTYDVDTMAKEIVDLFNAKNPEITWYARTAQIIGEVGTDIDEDELRECYDDCFYKIVEDAHTYKN